MKLNRRNFLAASALIGAKLAISSRSLAMSAGQSEKGPEKMAIPKRMLGKTGMEVSIVGMGGIVVMNVPQEQANKEVAESIEKGVNYFDVAPTYGNAEARLGPALEPYRKNVFLACKSTARDRKGIEKEMAQSMQRLRTDYFDVYQLHAIKDVEKDVKAALAKGGAMEAILEAKKQGKVRYIGFSAHSVDAAMAAMSLFDFDTMMYPINFACHMENGFDDKPVKEAKKKNIGIIAIKAMAKQTWPEGVEKNYEKCWYQPVDDPELVRKAINFTLSRDASLILPPGNEKLYRLALNTIAEHSYSQPTKEQLEQLQAYADDLDTIFPR